MAKISRNALAGGTEAALNAAGAGPAKEPAAAGFSFLPQAANAAPVEWLAAPGFTPYPDAVAFMEQRVAQIAAGRAAELIWLVEHPPLYTAGTSAKAADLLEPDRFPVYESARGGQFTYHGPGQRVMYIMLDLKRRRQDIRAFITAVEQWGINSLAAFGVKAERREDRVGIWVAKTANPGLPLPCAEAKIAAIGLRLRKWVSYHGMAVNISPNLSHYNGIVPCGIAEYGVTSLAQLGKNISFAEWDNIARREFEQIFGAVKAG